MFYLLDTNHCIYIKNALHKKREYLHEFEVNTLKVFERVIKKEEVFVSSVSIGELYYGAEKSEQKEKNFRKIEFLQSLITVQEVDDTIWRLFGKTKAELEERGKIITDFDLLIACTAKACNYTLVSNDKNHDVVSEDFLIENWANMGNVK